MKLTIVHPCIGRRRGEKYIRSWQMEPLGPATLAGLTPGDVEVTFFDDRMEVIDYDQPADLVAISVETYTARRAYQIASEFRKRGVPVVMGGFHATLVPEEVTEYAEAIVVGEAERLWPQVIADFKAGQLRRVYRQAQRPSLVGLRPDRSIFRGKRYLPIGLVEAGRGCHFVCEFCAIQSYFKSTQTRRPIEDILNEIRAVMGDPGPDQVKKKVLFFVDDNISSNMDQAKAFFEALTPLGIKWVSQVSINAAHDEDFLRLIKASGCQGVLIGFETLNPANLKQMKKNFNTMKGGYDVALANLRRHGIRIYPTFILGYDEDTVETFEETLAFALKHQFYMASFNHLTPFPGTPLYQRLEADGRLTFERWWLDERYRYGMVPYEPHKLGAREVAQRCVDIRRAYYSHRSILRRSFDFKVNSNNLLMWSQFFVINYMMRREVLQRAGFPLGDEAHQVELLKAQHSEPFDLTPVELLDPAAGQPLTLRAD